jgi:hypothetical protein
MDLTDLLVIVATIISQQKKANDLSALCDADRVRRLQQLLVYRLRNPASHTYANFSTKDSDFVFDLCADWLDVMAVLRGYANAASMPIALATPSMENLSDLLWECPGGALSRYPEGSQGLSL